MEAAGSSDTLLPISQSTQHYVQEDHAYTLYTQPVTTKITADEGNFFTTKVK